MRKAWPKVRLGKVVKPVERAEAPMPGKVYRQLGVKWWGEGVYERESIDGAQTRAPNLYRAEANDIIINKIWARHGSVAVVQPPLAGCYGSNEFPMFVPETNQVEPRWIHWLTKIPLFWQECERLSQGTSGKNRIRPERFLEIELPLPSLQEQQRLVARIEELVKHINEAKKLRQQATLAAENIMAGVEHRAWPSDAVHNGVPLEKLTTYLARGRQSEQGDSEHYLIKTQHVQYDKYVPTMMKLSANAASKVKPDAIVQEGDILIACSAAGCLGRVARYHNHGCVASTDTHVAIARPNADLIDPDYLYYYLRGAPGQHQLRSRERGDWQREKVGFRLTELNLKDLKKVPVPVPSYSVQRKIVAELSEIKVEVDALKSRQMETDGEIEAFIPIILGRAFNGEL